MTFFTAAPLAWKIPFFICLISTIGIFAFAPRITVSEPPKPPLHSLSPQRNSQTTVNSPNSKQQIIGNYYEAPKTNDDLTDLKVKLGRFVKEATPIREKLFKDRSDTPWIDTQAWEKEVLIYLESTRPDFAVAFESAADRSAIAYRNTSPEQSRRIKYLDTKVDLLRQIIMR